MLKQLIPFNSSEVSSQYHLKQDNLIPIYVLEDNMKSNFCQIQQFIDKQNFYNSNIDSNLMQTN